MAVAFDAASTLAPNSTQTPSWTHTPVGTPSGVGIIAIWRHTSTPPAISSVTYGGEECSFEDSQVCNSGLMIIALYSLANPPSGERTVQINYAATPNRDNYAYAVTVTGGSTSDVFATVAKNTATNTAPSVTVDSTADEFVMDGAASSGNMTAAGGGQTVRLNPAFNTTLNGGEGAGSTKAGASPSVTTSYTLAGNTDWGIVSGSFKAAQAGTEALIGEGSTSASGTSAPVFSIGL
jgi:hypothetical protein